MAVYLTLNITVMSLKCILDSISLSLYNAFLALSWSSRESCILDVSFFFVRLDFMAHSPFFFFVLCCVKIKEIRSQKSVGSCYNLALLVTFVVLVYVTRPS